MPASKRLPAPSPAPLPRGGRHALTQEAVAASQRARMIDAVGQVVAAKGYGAATVADVIAHAGVSRRTFYEQFPKLEDCFLAAYEDGMRQLFGAIREALLEQPAAGWRERVRIAIETYLRTLAALPGASWAFAVEALAAGHTVLELRARVLQQWVAQWRALVALREREEPGAAPVDDLQLLALVGGIEELVREVLRSKGPKQLPKLAGPATAFALAVLSPGAAGSARS